jgi:GGDEF domain-containing protein
MEFAVTHTWFTVIGSYSMHMLTKPEMQKEPNLVVIGQDWELLHPLPSYEPSEQDPEETLIALRQAEIVIRAQEDRIRTLEAIAQSDELTGLANRRGFASAFERELSLARRDSGCSGILVMIDLDAFKTINDKWGHQAGDAVARLGGDEFALLLTRMDEQTGAKRLAKLEQAFNKRALVLHERIPLRASFGFAPYSGTQTAESVMHAADVRLYAHKARNKRIIPVAS